MIQIGARTMARFVSAVISFSSAQVLDFLIAHTADIYEAALKLSITIIQDAVEVFHKDTLTQLTVDFEGLVNLDRVLDCTTVLDATLDDCTSVGPQTQIDAVDSLAF
jgi:hypothetical protein